MFTFEIGQTVFYMKDNVIATGTIFSRSVRQFLENGGIATEVFYELKYPAARYHEGWLFSTADDLLMYLKINALKLAKGK